MYSFSNERQENHFILKCRNCSKLPASNFVKMVRVFDTSLVWLKLSYINLNCLTIKESSFSLMACVVEV